MGKKRKKWSFRVILRHLGFILKGGRWMLGWNYTGKCRLFLQIRKWRTKRQAPVQWQLAARRSSSQRGGRGRKRGRREGGEEGASSCRSPGASSALLVLPPLSWSLLCFSGSSFALLHQSSPCQAGCMAIWGGIMEPTPFWPGLHMAVFKTWE